MTMKTLLPAILLLLLTGCSSINIYIVRHAEKQTGNNPHLTAAGQQRALALCDTMRSKSIGFIFSTDSNRTQETARPTANFLHLAVTRYSFDTLPRFVTRLKKIWSDNVLVVTHSTTITDILRAFNVTRTG